MAAVQKHDVAHTEVVTNDVEGTQKFYEKLYGWKFQDLGADMGNYRMGTLPGGATCGIRAPQESAEKPGLINYILVTDVGKTLTEAKRLGAKVVVEPQEVPGMGWFAVFDVHGVPNGVWQVKG